MGGSRILPAELVIEEAKDITQENNELNYESRKYSIATSSTSFRSRNFRSQSLRAIGNQSPKNVTWQEDVKHILLWEAMLIPSTVLICLGVFCNNIVFLILKSHDKSNILLLSSGAALLLYALAIVITWLDFRLAWSHIAAASIVKLTVAFSMLIVAHKHGYPWSVMHYNILLYSHTVLAAVVANVFVAHQLNARVQENSFSCMSNFLQGFKVAFLMGFGAGLSTFFIQEYAYIVPLLDWWVLEWIVTGVVYPMVSVMIGRLLIADIYSFILLYAFPEGSATAVLSYYSLLVKIAFYLPGQTAILLIQSNYAFVMSITILSIAELIGTFVNIQVTIRIKLKAETNCLQEDSDNFFERWLATRASVTKERLILHSHDEAVAEKLVIVASTCVALLNSLPDLIQNNNNTTITSQNIGSKLPPIVICYRGIILLVTEVFQDLVQRRILYRCTGFSLTGILPELINARQNVAMLLFILMILNILRLD